MFCLWAWLRLDKSALWLLPGMASLAAFAWLLALSPAEYAGRAYAAYGSVASLVCLWAVEGSRPDRWGYHRRCDVLNRRGRHSAGAAARINAQKVSLLRKRSACAQNVLETNGSNESR